MTQSLSPSDDGAMSSPDAVPLSTQGSSDAAAVTKRAVVAAAALAKAKGAVRSRVTGAIAQGLKTYQNDILEANTVDLEISREMAVPELVLGWLKLTRERLNSATAILQRLSELPDPIGRIMNATHPVEMAQTYSQLMPLGVVALVYEAFPDLGAIAAGMCIKTSNCLILRGGSEASHTNQVMAQVIRGALEESDLPLDCLQLLPADQGSSVRDLITQDQSVNLIIPYGRPSLVQQVARQATAPVLKSTMGNCYLYWAHSGNLEAVRTILLDSHHSMPDPVNAIEKVLVPSDCPESSLRRLWNSLREKGFEVRGDESLCREFAELKLAAETEWKQAYLSKIVAFRRVKDLGAAIAWINLHSNGHADCLVTESYAESRQFAQEVNSASTYINASPRFERNPKRGDTVLLGMSSQKGHRRGAIRLETLTTVKHIVQGFGQI
jgi:glutamate-5-semialdehyde dehydrogenase